VIASLVLFDGAFAFGALLCVGHDPGDVLALIRILCLPLAGHIARARPVRLLRALEAEGVPAFAIHVTHPVLFVLHAVVTALEGTPTHILIIIREGLAKPLHICLQVIALQVFQEHRVRNCKVTLMLRASRLHALREPEVYLLH